MIQVISLNSLNLHDSIKIGFFPFSFAGHGQESEVTPQDQAHLRTSTRASTSGRRGRPRKSKPKAAPKRKSAMKSAKAKASPMKAMKALPQKRKPRASQEPPADDVQPEPDKKLGCGRCRFAAKGCKTCRNPLYKPHAKSGKK